MSKHDLPDSVRYWRNTVLILFYCLLLVFVAISLSLTIQVGVTTVVIWLIQTFPLLIFTPALHRNYLRAYAWLSFVVLIYFVHGVLTAFSQDSLLLGVIESLLCSLLFIALIFYIRKYRTHFQVPL